MSREQNNNHKKPKMKERLDLLTSKAHKISRKQAQALIMAGRVTVNNTLLVKPGVLIDVNANIKITEKLPYVSRGALKLEQATKKFGINFFDKIVCDIGASTGGFTDFAIANGAKKVYAIDVGYGQLAQKLRNDKRVVVMERTNIKDAELLPEPIDIFLIDVSFISLKKVLPQILKIIGNCQSKNTSPSVIALAKPQFEVEREIADKYRGVITDQKIQEDVLEDIKSFSRSLGYFAEGATESPIKGAKGNREYLLHLSIKSS